MRKRWPLAVSLGVVVFASAAPAQAIPAFARRYQVACHFCHEGYPKLNLMGQRFKERGFRLEKEDGFDVAKWFRSIPVDLRATGTQLLIEDSDDGTFGFFKPMAAGNLGRRFSFWVDWGFIVRSDSLTPSDEDNAEFQDVSNAWGRIDIASNNRFYLKGGRIEMDIPFTQIRTPNLLSYEIYFANTGFESDNIGDDQDGAEIGGDLPNGFRWSAAVVAGQNPDFVDDLDLEEPAKFDANVFLRLAKRWERNRFGVFAYLGRNHLARPGVSLDPDWKNDITRLGLDADLWARRLNVYGVFMYGNNSNAIATAQQPTGTGEAQHFTGGFLQADYHAGDNFALTARVNVVNQPDGINGPYTTFSSFVPGVRFHVFDRLRLAFEYSFANQERSDLGAVQVDLAF